MIARRAPVHPAALPRLRIRTAGRLALAASLLTIVVGAVGIVSQVGSGAATSGWYVATTPGTGVDDVLLGSSCANATQCWAAGVSIENIGSGSGSTFAPLVETWNGTTWTLAATPPAPGRPRWRALRRLVRHWLRLLGGRGGARGGRGRQPVGDADRELERLRLVGGAQPHPDRSRCRGGAPPGRELRVGVELRRGRGGDR